MKKVLGFIAIIGLLLLTGCAADNEELNSSEKPKEKFYDLKYVEPKGYENVSDLGSDIHKIKGYIYEEGGISMNYVKNEDYSYIEEMYYTEPTEKEINGTKWRVIHDESVGLVSDFYYIVHNGDLYYIELNGIDKNKDNFEEFIKEVSF